MVQTTTEGQEPQPLNVLSLPDFPTASTPPAFIDNLKHSPPPYDEAMSTGTSVYVSSNFSHFNEPPKYPCSHDPTRVCSFCAIPSDRTCYHRTPARDRARSWHTKTLWLRVTFLLFSFVFIFLLYSFLYNVIVLEPLMYVDPEEITEDPTWLPQI